MPCQAVKMAFGIFDALRRNKVRPVGLTAEGPVITHISPKMWPVTAVAFARMALWVVAVQAPTCRPGQGRLAEINSLQA
jgi:hypothetical protein